MVKIRRGIILLILAVPLFLLGGCKGVESRGADVPTSSNHSNPLQSENTILHRLLASQRTLPSPEYMGDPVRVQLVLNASEFDRAWERFRLSGERPAVNWDSQVVLMIGTGESGSCPLRLVGVTLNLDEGLLTAHLVDRVDGDNGGPCTSDYNSRTFVVAVERQALPSGPLRVRVDDGSISTTFTVK